MNNFKMTFPYSIIIKSLTILILLGSPAYASHDAINPMKKHTFSDPSHIIEMTPEWERQPIKYGPSTGNADIVVTLDQHLYPALLPLIQKYAKENDLNIIANKGTCGISAGMLSAKTADIGGFCCPPGRTDRLPGLQFHTMGISPISLIVHPDNPIKDISIEDARKIFEGEMSNWSEIKSSNGKYEPGTTIQPVGRLHCKLRPGHWQLLLDSQDLFSMNLQEVGAIPDMVSKVASNKVAIGHVKTWIIKHYSDRGTVKSLNINGASPYNQEDIISGRYPLYASYYLTTWEGKNVENPKAKRLIAYLLKQSDTFEKQYHIIPASRLKKAGWKFKGNELIGEAK